MLWVEGPTNLKQPCIVIQDIDPLIARNLIESLDCAWQRIYICIWADQGICMLVIHLTYQHKDYF